MTNPRISWIAWFVVTALAVWHTASALSGMPDALATHFNGAGEPDAWMNQSVFVTFQVVLWGMLTACFWGFRPLLRRLPQGWVGIPRREYWLAPERRGAVLPRMSGWLEAYGLFLLLGIVGLHELVFAANLRLEPRLEAKLWWGGGAFVVGTSAWLVGLLRTFRVPREPDLPAR